MSEPAPSAGPRESVRAIGLVGLLAFAAALYALPRIDALGLYYDEAFLAQQARDFVEPGREHLHAASVRTVELFGRPFPVRNAAYLGSLKSQLLIPAFLVAGASPEVLRATTFATAWLGLLLTVVFVARILPARVAWSTGLLLATDPAFFFFGQFEWGPFTTNLLCRAAGLLLLTIAWQSPSRRTRLVAAAGGGGALGLGVFSRADFVLIVAGLLLGALIGHRRLVAETLRERRPLFAAAAAGAIVASAPMWLSALSLIGSSAAIADRGDLWFRADVLWSVLDGSQFLRLMRTGGLFDAARAVAAPSGLLGYAWIVSLLVVGADCVTSARRDPAAAARDPRRLLLVASVAITGATLALPGAVRAHHQLNGLPLWHVLIACAADVAWRRGAGAAGQWPRWVAAGALLAVVGVDVRLIAATEHEIVASGGRGRWTHAIEEVALALEAEPGAEAVSLDWGFHEPLLLLTDDAKLEEAIWKIPRDLAAGRPWTHRGDAGTRYLVHDAPYDLFGLGPGMLAAARAQPPGSVSIEAHTDREGAIAFYTIRILRSHRLAYRGSGRFTID